jgi:hypothetical protein
VTRKTIASELARSTTEAELLAFVRDLALLRGWLVHHAGDSRRSDAGLPDLILVRPPRVVFAELKTERGRLRPEQKLWIDALGACPGIEAYLWRPSDSDAIVSALR